MAQEGTTATTQVDELGVKVVLDFGAAVPSVDNLFVEGKTKMIVLLAAVAALARNPGMAFFITPHTINMATSFKMESTL
jgi:hypothetical protein